MKQALPNGGFLSVDTTLLQLGLSRCRCFAEDGLSRLQRDDEVDVVLLLESIVEEVRTTLHGVESHKSSAANEANAAAEQQEKELGNFGYPYDASH